MISESRMMGPQAEAAGRMEVGRAYIDVTYYWGPRFMDAYYIIINNLTNKSEGALTHSNDESVLWTRDYD